MDCPAGPQCVFRYSFIYSLQLRINGDPEDLLSQTETRRQLGLKNEDLEPEHISPPPRLSCSANMSIASTTVIIFKIVLLITRQTPLQSSNYKSSIIVSNC